MAAAVLVGGSSQVFTEARAEPQPSPEVADDAEETDVGEAEETSAKKNTSKKRRRRRRIRELPNPGKYDEAAREAKECLAAEAFAGARVDFSYTPVQKQSKVMAFQLGTHLDPSLFREDGSELTFMANVQNGKTLIVGRLDNKFCLFGRAQTNLTDNIQYSHVLQVSQEDTMLSCDLDYTGKDFTSRAKYVKYPGKHSVGCNYFQSVTPTTALGMELLHTLGTDTAMMAMARHQHLFNKKKEGDITTVQLDTRGAMVTNYTRKLSDNLALCSELTVRMDPRGGLGLKNVLASEAVVHIGAAYKYNGFRFQGSLKTSGDVVSVLDVMLAPAVCLKFSGVLNQFSNQSQFGVGLQIG